MNGSLNSMSYVNRVSLGLTGSVKVVAKHLVCAFVSIDLLLHNLDAGHCTVN